MRFAFGGAALLAVLPWLDPWLLVPAAPVALLLARWTARRGRGLIALGTIEIQLASLVFYVSLNERLYGGFTPLAAVADEPVTGAAVARRLRSTACRGSRRSGSTATPGCCAGRRCSRWRSSAPGCCGARGASGSRGSCADQRDVEHAAFLALAVCAAQVAVAAFARAARSAGCPGRRWRSALPCAVPLVAWGLRHAPRLGCRARAR